MLSRNDPGRLAVRSPHAEPPLSAVSRRSGPLGMLARVIALAALLAFGAAACGNDAPSATEATALSGIVREPLPSTAALSLPEVTNANVPLKFVAPKGDLLVLYFGYTSCPDVCPTTLADLKAAVKQLGKDGTRVQVAMATVDPRRDTTAKLTSYIRSFFPQGKALRTDDDKVLQAAATPLGLTYQTDYSNPKDPKVAHGAFVFVIDDTGHLALQWSFGTTPKDMAGDMKILLAKSTPN